MRFKQACLWIEDKWNKFEAWVASWMPGLKTKVITGLGAIGSLAATLQEFVTGLPITTFMTATQLTAVTLVLFVLSFWLRGLGDRVNARVSSPIT